MFRNCLSRFFSLHVTLSVPSLLAGMAIAGLIAAIAIGAPPRQAAHAGRAAAPQPQGAIGTAFTYQGRLRRDDAYLDGVTCSMRFGLYADPSLGAPLGTGLQTTSVALDDGYFTTLLDFGDVFDGSARYLESEVQCPGDAGYRTLAPRSALYGVPYAQGVAWGDIDGMPPGFADGSDDGAVYTPGEGIAIGAGNVISAALGGSGGEWGTASSLARSDHRHDSRYYTETEADSRFVNAGEGFGGDLSGTQPGPATVVGLRGRAVDATAPGSGQVLAWDGSAWTPADVDDHTHDASTIDLASGSTDGFLTSLTLSTGDNYLFTTAPFTPTFSGHCLVIASAQVETGDGAQNTSEGSYVRTAQEAGGAPANDGTDGFDLPPILVNGHHAAVTVSYVWPVSAGVETRFGCYVRASGDFVGDALQCRVSYMCE